MNQCLRGAVNGPSIHGSNMNVRYDTTCSVHCKSRAHLPEQSHLPIKTIILNRHFLQFTKTKNPTKTRSMGAVLDHHSKKFRVRELNPGHLRDRQIY